MSEEGKKSIEVLEQDEAVLARMGYKQELKYVWVV
jgi:hypothetical protein